MEAELAERPARGPHGVFARSSGRAAGPGVHASEALAQATRGPAAGQGDHACGRVPGPAPWAGRGAAGNGGGATFQVTVTGDVLTQLCIKHEPLSNLSKYTHPENGTFCRTSASCQGKNRSHVAL